MRMIKAPGDSNKRERSLLPDEEMWLLAGIEVVMPRTANMRALIRLALETGMRQFELLKIEWEDVDLKRKFIHLADTKSGDPRDVLLSSCPLGAPCRWHCGTTARRMRALRRSWPSRNRSRDGAQNGNRTRTPCGREF